MVVGTVFTLLAGGMVVVDSMIVVVDSIVVVVEEASVVTVTVWGQHRHPDNSVKAVKMQDR